MKTLATITHKPFFKCQPKGSNFSQFFGLFGLKRNCQNCDNRQYYSTFKQFDVKMEATIPNSHERPLLLESNGCEIKSVQLE